MDIGSILDNTNNTYFFITGFEDKKTLAICKYWTTSLDISIDVCEFVTDIFT
jgi:hypothetical protein